MKFIKTNLLFLAVLTVCFISTNAGLLTPSPSPKAYFYFYHGLNNNDFDIYDLNQLSNIFANPNFIINRTTTLYVHGYNETQTYKSIPFLTKAYSYRNDTNFLTLDWSQFVNKDYASAYANVDDVAYSVAEVLNEMFDAGLPIKSFHLVGHSLGGQCAGNIGRILQEIAAGLKILPRITALDPAFPLFYPATVIPHISKNDALFVDVIHTDAGVYGALVSTGTIDFWPNGGDAVQPGCPKPRAVGLMNSNDYCSHWCSWRIWCESVSGQYGISFVAYKDISYFGFKFSDNTYSGDDVTVIGLNTPNTLTGNYYLYTNPHEPRAKGNTN